MRESGDASAPIGMEADIEGLCAGGTPEGLHLEYKVKQDPSSAELGKDDRRNAAEAIAAFANSDGGTLVYGVRSGRRDGADVAVALAPIARVEAFAAQLRLVAELNVTPQVAGVEVLAIPVAGGTGEGYAAVRVPRSDARPHMSTAPGVHRYYRRSFTGSAIMTPSEVRDQILAIREAVLEPIVVVGGGGTLQQRPDWIGIQSGLSVRLRNVGTRLCRDPFLRIGSSCALSSNDFSFDARLAVWKSDYRSGLLIHVDDDGPAVSLRFLARLDKVPLRQPNELDERRLLDALTIYPAGDLHDVASFVGPALDGVRLIIAFGADNAAARTHEIEFTRDQLARRVLAGLSMTLWEMTRDEVGVWRQDLFAALVGD